MTPSAENVATREANARNDADAGNVKDADAATHSPRCQENARDTARKIRY